MVNSPSSTDRPRFYIAVTAHDPLSRPEAIAECLQLGWLSLPGYKDIFYFVDKEHEHDIIQFSERYLTGNDWSNIHVMCCDDRWNGWALTWAHKPHMRQAVMHNMYDYYIYAENDIKFNNPNFQYWEKTRHALKDQNLEPSFATFEKWSGEKSIITNHPMQLNTPTFNPFWGRDYVAQTHLNATGEDYAGFVSPENPYPCLMILDQEDATRYINSPAHEMITAHTLAGDRGWGIPEAASMGMCFCELKAGQEHRRVLPLKLRDGKPYVPDEGLVEHVDNKYTKRILAEGKPVLLPETMYVL